MLKHYTARTARAAVAMALAGVALLTGCDQIDTWIDRAREIATTFDLDTTFPVLVEALDADGVTTHANRRAWMLTFDRELHAFTHPG